MSAHFSPRADPGSRFVGRLPVRENRACQANSPTLASHHHRLLGAHRSTSDHHPLKSHNCPSGSGHRDMSHKAKEARQALSKTFPDSTRKMLMLISWVRSTLLLDLPVSHYSLTVILNQMVVEVLSSYLAFAHPDSPFSPEGMPLDQTMEIEIRLTTKTKKPSVPHLCYPPKRATTPPHNARYPSQIHKWVTLGDS